MWRNNLLPLIPSDSDRRQASGRLPDVLWMLFTLISFCLTGACQKDPTHLPLFRELPSPSADNLTSIWFIDSLHGVLTGGRVWERGFVMSTADGGQSWQTDTVVGKQLECVVFDSGGQGYVCGLDGLVLHRPPGLHNWYHLRTDFCWNRSCHFWDGRHGVVVAGEGFQSGQARKLGPEAPWIMDTLHLFPNALSGVWYSDSMTVHAVGLGYVLRSDDGGLSWNRLDQTGDFFQCVHFPTPSTGYICGASGTLLKTTDAGRSWQTMRQSGSIGTKSFRSVWFVSADKGYLVGDQGLLWRTENGGVDWTPLAGLPADIDATDIFVLGNRGWITCTGGKLFYFET